MPEHHHSEHPHTHAAPRRAAPAAISASILRLSVGQRLIAVAGMILVLWSAVHWAMR